jgi:uncharacterized membrane protein
MKALSFYQIFLLFIFYSFVGWTCEVLYCSISKKKFLNRGFLYGPICPIYGVGALVIFSLLSSLADNLVILFISSMVLTSIIEYFTSWIMEKLFDTKWWDYSNYKFNINGRVCLLNSTLFGIMGIVAVRFVHPFMLSILYSINDFWTKTLSISFMIIFIIDLVFTLKSLVNFKLYLRRFEDFIHSIFTKIEQEKWIFGKNTLFVNHSFHSLVIHIKSLKNNNIMETKENLMQSMSEKQNEVLTENFIADFALIDASVVQKKSAWDIANENVLPSFNAFF